MFDAVRLEKVLPLLPLLLLLLIVLLLTVLLWLRTRCWMVVEAKQRQVVEAKQQEQDSEW